MTNLLQFMVNNNLDSVNIDWEYPSALDIPGILASSLDHGLNYLAFL